MNKIDRLMDPQAAKVALENFPDAVAISALNGDGIDDLLTRIQEQLYELLVPLDVYLPYKEGKLISIYHEQGQIEMVEHVDGGVQIKGRIPGRLAARFSAYLKSQT